MTDPAPYPSADDSDPSPQIQQNLTGDRNQTIGQANDSTIVNFAGDGQVINLTIIDQIPTTVLPPSNILVQQLTQQEYRQRQTLLDKVKYAWIKGVLEKSLYATVLIELELQERPDLVQQPFSDVGEFAATPGQTLPEGTSTTDVFDRLGSGRTLLIVGEPGSGKTIALLKLAKDVIVRTEPDLCQQIPVVFNLSSWARKSQSIEQWLIQELLEKYQVSLALGNTWVESEALILFLDGLDEVKAEQRNACVQALNQFMQTHGTTQIVICCRIGDYQMLQDRLILRSAICLQPLTAAQVGLYFERAGDRLSALKAVLPQDAELQKLATSPLMLSVMSLACQDFTPEQLTLGGKIENYRQWLFANYVDRMFQRRGTTQRYSREDAQRWLIWLAQRMMTASQTVFLIERLQPSWLPTKGQRILYQLESGLICGTIFGLISGLASAMMSDILNGLSSGLMCGLIYGLWVVFHQDIKPIETLKLSWQEAKNGAKKGLIPGLIFGLIWGLIMGLDLVFFHREQSNLLFDILFFPISHSLVGCFIGKLVGGMIGGMFGSSILQREKPNQGIWKSLWNAEIIGIIIFAFFVFIYSIMKFDPFLFQMRSDIKAELGLGMGLLLGVIGGLCFGGNAAIRHFVLRLLIHRKRYAPWNYARFLDHATERLLLQKVGGGYIFVHRMLLEHFAKMSLEQGKP